MPRPVKAPTAAIPPPDGPTVGRTVSDKVMMLVDSLARSPEPQRLADLAVATATTKATCHRLLADLCGQGYATPAGGGRYQAGPRLRALAAAVRASDPRAALIETALGDLSRRTGQVASHGCRAGDQVVLLGVSNHQGLPIPLQVGDSISAPSALGRASGSALVTAENDPAPGTWTATIGIDPDGEEFLALTGFLVTRSSSDTAQDLLCQHALTLQHSQQGGHRAG